jgi:O-antigen ligase
MNNDAHRTGTDSWIWVTAFILANLRGTVIWDVLKQGFQITDLPWLEVFVWVILFRFTFRALVKAGLLAEYLLLWRRNWMLAVFIVVAFASVLWSVSASATFYRASALLFASLIGAYLGTRYAVKELLDILFQFGTILLILCFALASFLPIVGVMDWEPYNGAWRGIFWHKNQFGGLAALFNFVFLILLLNDMGRQRGRLALYAVFYLFSLVVIYFSESVAGYLLCIIMGFCTVLAFFWLRVRHRLKPIHYYGALGTGGLAAAILLLNLEFVFGLFNRSTSLTGRIPLWIYLIQEVFARSPWLGHGFGALWSLTSFRLETSEAVNWGLPVAIGDNGFLDILLHVGLLGFIPFLGVLLKWIVQSGKFAYRHVSITAFFPLLLAIYMVVANISFSFFLETETFLWLVLVATLFFITKEQEASTTQTS